METELAYLAGFFDGEGYVGIHRSAGRFSIRVSVTQLDPAPMVLFHSRFGGYLHRAPDKRGFRPMIVWTVTAGGAIAMLEAIRPLLTVKAEQVDVVMELRRRMLSPDPDRATELAEREHLYQLCRDLKRKVYDEIKLPAPAPLLEDHKGKRLPRVKAIPKPKPPKAYRVRVAAPVISEQGRDGRPARGQSKMPDAETLRAIYVEKGLNETARVLGVSRQSVINWLGRYGIEKQGRTVASERRRAAAVAASWSTYRSSQSPI